MAVSMNYFSTLFSASAAVTQGIVLKEAGHLASSNLPTAQTSTATTDKILGVADNGYSSGELGTAITHGICDFAIAGETLTPGTTYHVTVDGSGRLVAASAGVAEVKCVGYFICGYRSDGTAHVGEQCRINVNLHSLAPSGA